MASVLRADNPCDAPGDIPDVIVGELQDITRWGSVNNITAYSVGTYSCNIGTCWLDWQQNTTRHPVIGQNMYRLKNGRFEQIGQSWLKHGFFALSDHICGGPACSSTDGSHLGINCSDPYGSGLNGGQTGIGPKDEVNPSTGVFLWPFRTQNQSGNAIYKRLQVHNVDLDPAQNVGAQYWVEGTYLFPDDAPQPDNDDDATNNGVDDFDQQDNSYNNSSYKPITITQGSPGVYNAGFAGAIVQQRAAIFAWRAADPTVLIDEQVVPGDGRYWIASKATDLGNGLWHYEYAVFNHTSERGARSFSVPLPFGVNVSNIGFHDVDYHSENADGSGSFYDGTDWSNNGGADLAVTWSTLTFADNARANALRWTTLYNFRFDADVAPAAGFATASIELFKPGSPTSITARVKGPTICNSNAVCDIGETSSNCVADCVNQANGGGVCGDGTCNLGETSCSCLRDCGPPATQEFTCNDGKDNDCDGLADCADSDCCSAANCGGADTDGDGFRACDCNNNDPQNWTRPGEVEDLMLSRNGSSTELDWLSPIEPGGTSVTYEALRSGNSANFTTSTTCLPDGDATDTTLLDPVNPSSGGVFFYEVRAVNGCPAPRNDGILGRNSDNIPRQGRACP